MTNKYLEKIAETTEKNNTKRNSLLLGGAGALSIHNAPQRLLGYHEVFHGTNSNAAKEILKHGLDPSFGGSGAAKVSPEFFGLQSKGKIHVTKSPLTAAIFSGWSTFTADKFGPGGFKDNLPTTTPSIIKARISDKVWNNMKIDSHAGSSKRKAATSTHKISSKFISGSEDYAGLKPFLKARHLKNYYGTTAGKLRALRGVGMLAGGAGAIYKAQDMYRNHDK